MHGCKQYPNSMMGCSTKPCISCPEREGPPTPVVPEGKCRECKGTGINGMLNPCTACTIHRDKAHEHNHGHANDAAVVFKADIPPVDERVNDILERIHQHTHELDKARNSIERLVALNMLSRPVAEELLQDIRMTEKGLMLARDIVLDTEETTK